MISFDLGSPVAAELADLEIGDFFIAKDNSDAAILGVIISQLANGDRIGVLVLTGKEAFQIRTLERRYREHVIALKLDPARVKLRIDLASGVAFDNKHVIGRLLFGSSMAASVAVVYSNLAAERYCNAVTPRDWSVHQVHEPRFLFDRWSLSYVDEAGEWVDLVRREPA